MTTRFVHGVTSDLFRPGEDASQKKKKKKTEEVIHIRIKAMHKECDSSLHCVQGGLQFDVPRSHTPDGDPTNSTSTT
jgi:hypothetical protein